MNKFIPIFLLLAITITGVYSLINLEKYNVDPASITVSGISSGGAMATQFHFIHSSLISGAGIFAGIPYLCRFVAGSTCLFNPETMDVERVLKQVEKFARMGLIDPTENLIGDRAYNFHGILDEQPLMLGEKAAEMYEHYGLEQKTIFDMQAHHGQPTDAWGPPCTTPDSESQGIINCNYNGAFEMLNFLLGENLIRPEPSLDESLHSQLQIFNQNEFLGDGTNPPSAFNLGPDGFIYVPTNCRDSQNICKLHIAFHGCGQTKDDLDDIYATKTSYIETGEANDIIVLFPQSLNNATAGNPRGCWNWWGFSQPDIYPTYEGFQGIAVYRMLQRILFGL